MAEGDGRFDAAGDGPTGEPTVGDEGSEATPHPTPDGGHADDD